MASEFAPNEGNLNPVSVLPLIMSPVLATAVKWYLIGAARAGMLIASVSAGNTVHRVRIIRQRRIGRSNWPISVLTRVLTAATEGICTENRELERHAKDSMLSSMSKLNEWLQ
jgi:hypothetical protein